jgi:hypothetical protein
MMLKLNGPTDFTTKAYQKHLRLLFFKNGGEYVCREESKKRLLDFLAGGESQVFKGRLQLWKKSTNIFDEIKGEIEGVLALADFKKLLENTTNQQPVSL